MTFTMPRMERARLIAIEKGGTPYEKLNTFFEELGENQKVYEVPPKKMSIKQIKGWIEFCGFNE